MRFVRNFVRSIADAGAALGYDSARAHLTMMLYSN